MTESLRTHEPTPQASEGHNQDPSDIFMYHLSLALPDYSRYANLSGDVTIDMMLRNVTVIICYTTFGPLG